MKYLKNKEQLTIEADINDMFVEINDDNPDMIIYTKLFFNGNLGVFIRTKSDEMFEIDEDIKEVILRIYQYMRENKYYSNMSCLYSLSHYYQSSLKKAIIFPGDRIRINDRGAWVDIEQNSNNWMFVFKFTFYDSLIKKENDVNEAPERI
jgi:hypothetical protein